MDPKNSKAQTEKIYNKIVENFALKDQEEGKWKALDPEKIKNPENIKKFGESMTAKREVGGRFANKIKTDEKIEDAKPKQSIFAKAFNTIKSGISKVVNKAFEVFMATIINQTKKIDYTPKEFQGKPTITKAESKVETPKPEPKLEIMSKTNDTVETPKPEPKPETMIKTNDTVETPKPEPKPETVSKTESVSKLSMEQIQKNDMEVKNLVKGEKKLDPATQQMIDNLNNPNRYAEKMVKSNDSISSKEATEKMSKTNDSLDKSTEAQQRNNNVLKKFNFNKGGGGVGGR